MSGRNSSSNKRNAAGTAGASASASATTSTSKNSNKPSTLGGSHPQELKAEHRQFLVRSLDRNDVDLAALAQVNRSLKLARAQILESCGELVLLDLGVGRLTLVNDELHEEKLNKNNNNNNQEEEEEEEGYSLTPAQKALCVDFLWRKKLRRRLANRLVRRLQRLAQAMDGADVSPPPPPRYGDLRLHMDPAAVQAQAERWEQQALAKQVIQQTKTIPLVAPQKVLMMKAEKQPPEETNEEPTVVTSGEQDPESKDTTGSIDETPPKDATTTPEEPVSAPPKEEPGSTPPHASNDEPTLPAPPPPPPSSSGPDPVESTIPTTDTDTKPSVDTTITQCLPSLQEKYDILREYNDAYEKVWDPDVKQFTYVVGSEEASAQPEYLSLQAGAAIGAQTRLSTEQERAQEHQRWQASLLARIPHPPTLEELGWNNRVFYLEARRKRCLEESVDGEGEGEEEEKEQGPLPQAKKQKVDEAAAVAVAAAENDNMEVESSTLETTKKDTGPDDTDKKDREKASAEKGEDEDEAKTNSSNKDTENDDDSSSDMFEDEEDDNKNKATDDKDEDESSDMFSDDNDEETGKDKEDAEKEEEEAPPKKKITLEPRKKKDEEAKDETPEETPKEEPKRIRPMSLAAIPSFYEQDLNRIRAVHGDLLSSSILEHAHQQMAESTNEYNTAFRLSNQLYEHRTRLQQNLAYFHARSKSELAKVNSEHSMQVAMAKQRWLKQKMEHDKNRAQQFLPSNWGQTPFGTNVTQNYQRRGGVASMVGGIVADLVDGAIIMLEGNIPNLKFDDFVPPPEPHTNQQTGETMAQQHYRMENELKRQLQECTTKLQASEEERQRAWTRMMKTKAEVEPSSNAGGRRGRIDLTNYHMVPLPALRNSGTQQLPREFVNRTTVASYIPPRAPTTMSADASDSKYSAARVRERISSDGSVAPVTEPKKRDGLYMRPAGRTRKGMQWDAVRGIWVPEGSQ